MKTSTLHSLMTARILYQEAERLAASGDRHMCSAALIVLQDALEIIVVALLVEKGIDEGKSLESKSFDELVGELKKAGITVPKSGTLKALNKQRVIAKHYGELAEPVTVQGFVQAAEFVLDSIVPQVLGKNFRDVLLTDLMADCEARLFLTEAATFIEKHDYLAALIAIRKAIYVEIEFQYAINKWADADMDVTPLAGLIRGGRKAPYWTKNKKWIEANVSSPTDYVQIDRERLRIDGLEWGINTAELENLLRLTPAVFRFDEQVWQIRYDLDFPPNEATPSNARYCLDRATSILLRKQQHEKAARWPRSDKRFDPPTVYLDAPVFNKASQDSTVVHNISNDFDYRIHSIVTGFKWDERYYVLYGHKPIPGDEYGEYVQGFLLIQTEDDI